ncbi:MAG: T9SS type A sorting domain-containing protein [Sphingobacteriaceae bacterium]|nr:T9SS type A sorting domain-containing protein [Sphingobacteriaceae bacterium]
MKHFYSLIFLTVSCRLFAQIPIEVRDIDNANALVSNNQIFQKTTTAGGTDFSFHFEIKNTSANTITVSVRKYEDLMNTVTVNDKAEAYFCFNTYCYIPSIITATTQMTSGSTFTFLPKLDEASVVGESKVRYRISAEGNDFYVDLRYNAPVGINEVNKNINSLLVYPSPASEVLSINLQNKEIKKTTLSLYNSLGALIISEIRTTTSGNNSFDFNVSDLNSGIYFLQIKQGEEKMTKKIIISN